MVIDFLRQRLDVIAALAAGALTYLINWIFGC